ncbi:MAG: DUF4157 domain-containing protein, partial [Candidatus Methanoperedens sp.]|nr:DUF4157 domain-containing protein [Candidatus Methanoperedens sp.]
MPEPQVSKETEVSNPARNNSIQRRCPGCKKGTKIGKEEEEEKLQKKEAAGLTPEVTPELESSISAFRGGGQPLPESMRAFYEPRFGADFTGVRVHVDTRAAETAKSINAMAFTAGQNIAFGAGHYAPESREGRRLLAHELAHIVQQSDGMAPATWPMHMGEGIEVSRADDPLQAEDHMFAGRAASSTIFREGERDLRKLEPYYPYQTSEYIERFGDKIKGDLRAEMRGVVLPIGSRFVSWVAGSESRFIESILGTLLANGGKALEADLNRYLTPPAVASAINLGREIGSIEYKWLGGKDYFPAVALEMRKVLAKQLADSVPRIVPRYLAARNQAALAEQVRTKQSQTTPPEPDQARIIASVPIDRLVIPALCAGTVTVNLDAYRAARPEERRTRETQSLRTIAEGDWRFESVQGLWSWIRVFRPEDTTIEEVAKLLYGDETHSRRIVPAPPFFGFDPDRLSGAMLDRWEAQAGKDEGDIQYRILKDVPSPNPGQRETTLQHGYDPGRSAAVELLHGTQADEIALIQARGLKPTGATRDTIVSRIAVSLKLLDRSAADAKRFGLNFEPARTRLQERLDILKSLVDPRLAHRWDAESAGQLAILQRAMIGLRVAATYHAAMEKQAPPQQTVGPPSTYSFFVTPVIELGRTYVEVAQISELVVTAQQKLGEGDDRAKRLPLDFAEARLRMMRQTLAHAAIDKLHPEQRYSPTALETKGIAGLSREEMRLSHQIAAVREQLAIDPDAAVSKLNALGVEFDKLQLGVQLTGIVEHLWELFSTTLEGYSGSSGLGAIFNSGDYKVEMSRILLWLKRWERLLQSYREGKSDSTQFKKELKEIGENPEWKKLFESVLSRLRDLKQREAWINFGAKIAALVAIALVTAGVGALAEGAGLGFWATAGLEAFSFTALTLPFEEKASVQGFFLHLFQNWATFGLVKGAMALYEAAVGEKFARTLLGKGIGGVASFATATTTMIVQAEIESLARRNRSLTASEIKWITGESTAVTFATILAARYARPFLTELRIHGEAFHVEIETINAMRTENAALAKIVKETKSLSLAKKLAEADGKQADIEGEVLHKLSRDGAESKDRDGRPLSPEQRQAVADLTKAKAGEPSPLAAAMSEQAGVARARMLVDMESAGPDLFLAEPGKDIIDIAKRFH